MKQIAFLALILTLFLSQFNLLGATVSSNTVAIAVMILLLVLFSDLAEFDFWGLRGTRQTEEIKKLAGVEILDEKAVKVPSAYKVRQAEKIDLPTHMDGLKENFLALSFEIERQMRIIVRSLSSKQISDTQLTPDFVLNQLTTQGLLTNSADALVIQIRQIRELVVDGNQRQVTTDMLEAGLQLASEIYTQLKEWLENSKKTR
ncbi:hypothetical protein KKF92_00030 [Patescibacteria group bacterium]|nr:hypothetical protein [Patescibacteria group bacterium]